MCGIVGYIGDRDLKKVVLDGLGELEYRGYDSAGFVARVDNEISCYKATGKLENLKKKSSIYETKGVGSVIGHTRWATHGKPTEINAHPHSADFTHIVHNGIIENYTKLKKELEDNGVKLISQTDTEVIVHIFEEEFRKTNTIITALEKTISKLEGAYALLLITKSDKDRIYFAKHGSPLVIGTGEDENFFASSDAPLIGLANSAIYLEDGDYGYISRYEVNIFNKNKEKYNPNLLSLPESKISAQKEGYRFFMEKEIYEQAEVINDTLIGRLGDDKVILNELDCFDIDSIESIKLCACGTSYHAAMASAYLFERVAKIPTTVEIASEFRYKDPILNKNTLFVVISQSGETADTLEALKMAKRAGLKSLAICNVDNSSIVREADSTILTRAGIEKGVASTKAFATQVMTLWLTVVKFAQVKKSINQNNLLKELKAMSHAYTALEISDNLHEKLKRLSKRYLHGHGFFFIGRDIFYPLALEGALKLKEISYLHAEGYPSGEMKHGPIALADTELFTIALLPKTILYDKTKSNIEELSARDSTICTITADNFELADDLIQIKEYDHIMLEFFAMMVVEQLLSMEIAIRLGNDVDMPRNLAKSVTVE